MATRLPGMDTGILPVLAMACGFSHVSEEPATRKVMHTHTQHDAAG